MSVSPDFRVGVTAALLLAFSGLQPVLSQPQAPQARILRIERQTVYNNAYNTGSENPSAAGDYMTKFIGKGGGGAGSEVFAVYWNALGNGLDADAMVTFEFRQQFDDAVKFKHIKYSERLQGDVKSKFTVPENTIRIGGPVTAWRVRVVKSSHVLAEYATDNWR